MADISFRGKDYDVPRLTFRVQHEIEKACKTPYSQMTEAQRAAGMLWYMVRGDVPDFTVDAALDEDITQFLVEQANTDDTEDEARPL